MKFRIRPFAMASGILWGTALCTGALWAWLADGRVKKALFLGRFYRGYDASPKGSVMGLLWGFTDGAIGGSLFASVYNMLSPAERREAPDKEEQASKEVAEETKE
jgi:hypothetical protein